MTGSVRAAPTGPAEQEASERAEPTTGARRDKLVAVAGELFRAQGYHAVGMRVIASAANMRAASVYHHFRSKEDLLLEAIFRVNRDLIHDHLPILDAPGTYSERLWKLVHDHVVRIGNNRDGWWLSTRELRSLSPKNLERVQVDRRYYQRRISHFIEAGVRAGEFRCTDPRLATLATLDMVNGFNEWFIPGGRYTIDGLADYYANLTLHGVVGSTLGNGRP